MVAFNNVNALHSHVLLWNGEIFKALSEFHPDKYGGGDSGFLGNAHVFRTESDPGVGGGQHKC